MSGLECLKAYLVFRHGLDPLRGENGLGTRVHVPSHSSSALLSLQPCNLSVSHCALMIRELLLPLQSPIGTLLHTSLK